MLDMRFETFQILYLADILDIVRRQELGVYLVSHISFLTSQTKNG
jgi:hypothetical protein